MASTPRIGVALGSGGARGIAHIVFIEAMDEMGLAPSLIAGTSIGALIGAGWASGMSGRELREHATRVLANVQEIAGRLWTVSHPNLKSIIETGVSVQVDAADIVDAYLPEGFPEDFSALRIPFKAVSTDYYRWEQTAFGSGPLRPAIAASLAIPGLFRPVRHNGRLMIDGGATNPLPLDHAHEGTDIVVGIDVNGLPTEPVEPTEPNPIDVGFMAAQIMTQSLVRQAMVLHPPDVLVHAPVNGIRILEFWRVREILALAEAEKDNFKRSLDAAMQSASRRKGSWLGGLFE